MNSSYNSSTTKPLFRGTQTVWFILSILEALLAFRFILKLTGANPEAGFTNFIYAVTWPFTAPFLAVFPKITIQNIIFEWTTLLAMLVYWLIAVGIIRLLRMSKTVSTSEAADKLDEQEEK
jgi:ABC-type Na+ efflux pump permease subunit